MKIAKRIAAVALTGVVTLSFGVAGASMASAAPKSKSTTTTTTVVTYPTSTVVSYPVTYDANGNIIFQAPNKQPGLDPLPTN